MNRRPIKIDWHEVESAFEKGREDLVYYLDLVTGQVILEGQGGDARDDDDQDVEVATGNPRRKDSTRLYVEPPDPGEEAEWIDDFVEDTVGENTEAVEQLRAALDQPDPIEAFREILRNHPSERDRWFLYRGDRLHQRIDSWLERNQVRSTEPPPWR